MPGTAHEPPRLPPVVSVSGGRAPVAAPPWPVRPASRRGTAVLVGALSLAAAAATLLQPPPPPPVEATLRVLADRIATSQAGVVVVLVEADNLGPAVVVEALVVRAEPVRSPPSTNGVRRVAAASRGGFAVVVQPDCAALAPAGPAFSASLTVALRTGAGARRDVVLDLAADPAVVARLAGLCGRRPG